jgi:hypothetical protein
VRPRYRPFPGRVRKAAWPSPAAAAWMGGVPPGESRRPIEEPIPWQS